VAIFGLWQCYNFTYGVNLGYPRSQGFIRFLNKVSGFVNLKEAARLSGYHQDYLSQLIRSGKLSGTRVGKEWLTTRIALANYMDKKHKVPVAGKELRLSWWRRHAKFVALGLLFFISIVIVFGVLNFEKLQATIAVGDFSSSEVGAQKVLITDSEGGLNKELVVTTYTLDEAGGVEVSVTAQP
jgi:excisionase family DNA binding protein